MNNDLTHINYEAMAYSASLVEQIISICDPLFKNFPISTCHYSRLFPEGRYLALTSDSRIGEHIIKNGYQWRTCFFKKELQNISGNHFRRILWPYPTNDALIKGSAYLNLGRGITLARLKDDYIESFNFISSSHDYQIQLFYINNINVLEEFISYFLNKVSYIFKDMNSYKFAFSPTKINLEFHRNLSFHENIKIFLTQIEDSACSNSKSTTTAFSPQEGRCLLYLSQGKTAKEIARILQLSPRTVENYLDNIRKKTGYRKKVEIIKLFESSIESIRSQGVLSSSHPQLPGSSPLGPV